MEILLLIITANLVGLFLGYKLSTYALFKKAEKGNFADRYAAGRLKRFKK
jgi:hypothetical protein